MKMVNRQSLELGNELRNNTLEKDRERFKNTQLPTLYGYIFESTVAKINNLRCIAIGSPERYITDRMTKWKGKINDQVTDIQIVNNGSEKSLQLKCCKNPYNTVRNITKSNEIGSSKYSDQILCVPSDQLEPCKEILYRRIENIKNNSEISIFDTDNPELPGYTEFSSKTNPGIWNLLRYQNALDGLKKSEDILTPSYSETLIVVQQGCDSRFLKREIKKTNNACIRNLALKEFSKESCLDSCFLLRSENLVPREILIRYGKSALSSLITGGLVHQMGLKGIPVSNYLNSAFGSVVRAALHCTEAAVCSASKPGEGKKTVERLYSNMVEESQRLLVKFAVNYYTSKREDKELSKIC